ncbi:Type III effector HopAI1 [Pseudomonas amygdali pv. lachrymans]|uniref:Type III effector HopAI1 n=2 Tax=Pseudomonas amygdali pv. lachrymans TaxID=53707 RepID=A0AB37RDL4_PSEAV|nr:hypothetical protein PLA107_023875 [Pseudomonas amygdali pv. lachrymans str. M301315]KKY57709.1 hypothetical protein AAY85_14510 [Pseudomonas amygdali pv. lachrymans]KPC02554.1 Type III effector HopAI1 [Pseudomonas amygdali pv. lachrymans]KPC22935.1 Type III effector HopAI1 [Pseudomonas amygdali pv. lachrymans]PWD02244.1 hypothetical protein CX658_07220 [Pseudomonas amygdali pv. lachrymans]
MPINRPAFNLKLNTAIAQPTVKKDAGAELRRLNQSEVRANTQTRFAVNHRAPLMTSHKVRWVKITVAGLPPIISR